MSKTYAVASAKGGVGKTTTVANLGTALASAGADVVVVDADIGMANLAGVLGIEPDGPTLHTVLAGDAEPDEAVYEGPAGLAVLPGSPSLTDYRDADPTGLAELVDDLAEQYEYVLLDTGAGLSHDAVLPLGIADEVLLVSTPHREALGDTDKTRELVERLGGTVAGLVLTRVPDGTDVDDTPADIVDADVLELVPDDPSVDEAITAGEPIVSYEPTSGAAAAYRRLAAEISGLDVPEPEAPGESDTTETTTSEGGESGSEAAETDESEGEEAAEEGETAEEGTAEEEEGAEEESEGSPIAEAEPRKSVGPLRDEHVPVREDEEDQEPEDEADEQESPLADEKEEEQEKKGFFSRLLGR